MRMFYLRNKKGFPVTCVVSQKNGDDIQFNLATYNPHDEFDKREMHNLAMRRLLSGPNFAPVPLSAVIQPEKGTAVKARIVKAIIENRNVYTLKEPDTMGHPVTRRVIPHRAKNVARLWLKRREKAEKEKGKKAA